jgi:glycosyltransferase involved in cell wall biosynthesis
VRVGWLADSAGVRGGAELTSAEFRAAVPEGVEVVDCPHGAVIEGLDVYVIQNCVLYDMADLEAVRIENVVKYWHDVGPHLQPEVRQWLDVNASSICCSPLQAKFMEPATTVVGHVPPPVNLSRFEDAAARQNGNRKGSVSVGSWRNYGKAPHRVAEWGAQNGGVDFYGGGMFAPGESREIPYESMPELLASYERFVFLPSVLEPFGRVVAEAWAAGCEIVTNDLVGAKWWITERPEAIETAAEDFWKVVLDS